MPLQLICSGDPQRFISRICDMCGANSKDNPKLQFVSSGTCDVCFECVESGYSLMTSIKPLQDEPMSSEVRAGSFLLASGAE